jgi:hypothetical protein
MCPGAQGPTSIFATSHWLESHNSRFKIVRRLRRAGSTCRRTLSQDLGPWTHFRDVWCSIAPVPCVQMQVLNHLSAVMPNTTFRYVGCQLRKWCGPIVVCSMFQLSAGFGLHQGNHQSKEWHGASYLLRCLSNCNSWEVIILPKANGLGRCECSREKNKAVFRLLFWIWMKVNAFYVLLMRGLFWVLCDMWYKAWTRDTRRVLYTSMGLNQGLLKPHRFISQGGERCLLRGGKEVEFAYV